MKGELRQLSTVAGRTAASAGFNPANATPEPPHATLLQPFVAGIYNWGNTYLHGFS